MLRNVHLKLRTVLARGCSAKRVDLEMDRIVWIDMEMTGLDVNKDVVLEVACLITDGDLNILADGPDMVIHHDRDVLDDMNEWSEVQHRRTGLTEASSNSKIILKTAENELLEFMKRHVKEKICPLAGNSVYMDRLFVKKYFPKVDDYLHYRLIDVSTIKELCKRWNYPVYQRAPKKALDHRALSDIKESVKELRYYKEAFFKNHDFAP